jgi:multicomponent Na+:H+ antiporter subunit F
MGDALTAAAGLILAATALAALRILSRREGLEQMLAAQLLGTWGAAVLLLMAFAQRWTAILDVALVLALLAAFSSTAYALTAEGAETDGDAAGSGTPGSGP